MSELRAPIRELLGGDPDEAAAQRIWARVSAPRRRNHRRWLLAGAATVAVAVGVALVAWPTSSSSTPRLALADGRAFVEVAQDSREPEPRRVSLSDGSHIDLEPGVALQVARNEPHEVHLSLTRGAAVFEVAKVRGRAWVVDAAGVRVEVTGTQFRVERTRTVVHVSVTEGTVIVRGPSGETERLAAGDATTIPIAPTPAPAPAPAPTPTPTPALTPTPTPTPTPTAGDLMARADRARAARRPADAVAPLSELAARFPDDPSAPTAAFTLGVILLEELGQPEQAAEAFGRALELGLPEALTERAYARRVQAHAAAGDRDAATRAAAAYAREFPDGRFADEVRQWSAP